jgi:hypothetical protein
MRRLVACSCVLLTLFGATSALAVIEMPAAVIGGGGGDTSGGSFQLRGTISQDAIGDPSGGSYNLEVGFWRRHAAAVTPVETVPAYIWSLDKNYPNPFNPMTTIAFTLPAELRVRLEVYDVRGHRVRSLVDEVRAPGPHNVVWNGRDDGGRAVASGTYFARLVSEEGILTQKMLLTK